MKYTESFSQSLHQPMCLFHFRIYFCPLKAISLNFRESTNIFSDYKIDWILFLSMFKKIVEYDYLFNHLAVWMIALSNVGLHLLDNSLPLFLDQIHVLLLIDFVLLSFHLVFYLLHCICCKGSKFLLDLGLDVFVVLSNLMLLAVIFFLLVHYQFFRIQQIIIKEKKNRKIEKWVFLLQLFGLNNYHLSALLISILFNEFLGQKKDSKSSLQLFFPHLMLKFESIRLQISV